MASLIRGIAVREDVGSAETRGMARDPGLTPLRQRRQQRGPRGHTEGTTCPTPTRYISGGEDARDQPPERPSPFRMQKTENRPRPRARSVLRWPRAGAEGGRGWAERQAPNGPNPPLPLQNGPQDRGQALCLVHRRGGVGLADFGGHAGD